MGRLYQRRFFDPGKGPGKLLRCVLCFFDGYDAVHHVRLRHGVVRDAGELSAQLAMALRACRISSSVETDFMAANCPPTFTSGSVSSHSTFS